MNITAKLVTLDGKTYAEYENENGSLYLCVDADLGDFNDFAEVKFNRDDYVTSDREYDRLKMDYDEWFDNAEDLRTEYAQSLPAYKAFVQLASSDAKEIPMTAVLAA